MWAITSVVEPTQESRSSQESKVNITEKAKEFKWLLSVAGELKPIVAKLRWSPLLTEVKNPDGCHC